jgi:hypothetical protein
MKTKCTTTTRRPTRKNKRIMSGGKGKISKYTQRFKKQYKRFIGINDADEKGKMEKMEIWGKMNSIYKFLQAQNQTYKGVDGGEVSGIDKMKENIQNTSDLTNKEEYIKAIDCFKKGGDTILYGGECVSYSDFVNSGGATAGVEAPVAAPVAEEETSDSPAAQVDADKGNNAEQDDDEAAVQEETSDAPVAAPVADAEEETSDAPAAAAAATVTESDADVEGTEDTSAAPASVDSNIETQEEEEEDASKSQQPTAAAAVPSTSEQDGGRPRHRARPSRRIKSRKSKKGRMTRRKHRAVRR